MFCSQDGNMIRQSSMRIWFVMSSFNSIHFYSECYSVVSLIVVCTSSAPSKKQKKNKKQMPFGRQRSVHSPFSSIPRVCPHVNELKVKLARYVVHRSHKYLLKNKRKQPLHRLSVCLSLSLLSFISKIRSNETSNWWWTTEPPAKTIRIVGVLSVIFFSFYFISKFVL